MKGSLMVVEEKALALKELIEKQKTLLSRQSDVEMEIDNYERRRHLQVDLISWITKRHLTASERFGGIAIFGFMVSSVGAMLSPVFLEKLVGLQYYGHEALWLGLFVGLGSIFAFSVGASASSGWSGQLQNETTTVKYLERRYEILLREREELRRELEGIAQRLEAPIEEGAYRTGKKS